MKSAARLAALKGTMKRALYVLLALSMILVPAFAQTGTLKFVYTPLTQEQERNSVFHCDPKGQCYSAIPVWPTVNVTFDMNDAKSISLDDAKVAMSNQLALVVSDMRRNCIETGALPDSPPCIRTMRLSYQFIQADKQHPAPLVVIHFPRFQDLWLEYPTPLPPPVQ